MRQIIIAISLIFILILPIKAQEKIYLPILFKDGIRMECDRTWRIIKPDGMTNFIHNPSAEISAGFSAVGGASVSRVTTFSHYGLYSYRIQTSGNNEGIRLSMDTLGNETHFITVRVRGSLPIEWDWELDSLGALQPTLIESLDDNWNLYGMIFSAALSNTGSDFYIRQVGIGSGDFYIDGIQIEQGSEWTMYCDGTQPGCEWNGVAHDDASSRSAVSRAGGIIQDLWDKYGFLAERIIGAGATVENLNARFYATLPGGELSGSKVEPREFAIIGRFIGKSEVDLHNKRQALLEELKIRTYPGSQPVLINYTGAAVQKQISAYYQGGLEGALDVSFGRFQIQSDDTWIKLSHWTEKVSIQFFSPDPFFYEIGESSELLDTNDSDTFRIVAGRLTSTGQWADLGPPDGAGTYSTIEAIAEDETYIYFGGGFLNFDNIANADFIVRWNKSSQVFSALDVGLNDTVRALAIAPNGDLYIGGEFLNAGGAGAADYLTRWDGSSFFGVGTPNTGAAAITSVNALQFDQAGNLYIGGDFANWNDIAAADNIVMWDGSAYSALSTGTNNNVDALALDKNNLLYLGGNFTTPETRIASWDGSSFSGLSTGMNSNVDALAIGIDGVTLFAGGLFTTAGAATVSRIARWNATSWQALGSGVNGGVEAFSVGPDGVLYVGGIFTSAGGIALADRVARWNGSTWAHLDLDLPGTPAVRAILASRSDPVISQNYDLWLGFTTEGTGNFAGLATIENDGTQPVFPKIIINRTGGTTATLETLRNETIGKLLLFDYGLLDGETLTIDLTPTNKSIISSQFGPRLDAVLANSDFGNWDLQPNDNDVTSFVATAGGPTITAWMIWKDTFDSFD